MNHDWLISVRVKCKICLILGAVICDLCYAREVLFSMKLLCKIGIISAKLVNYESIIQG